MKRSIMVSATSVLLCAAILSGIAWCLMGFPWNRLWITVLTGWTEFHARCFKFISERKNWAGSEKICQNIGGNLASVHSEDEFTFIRELVKQHDSSEPGFWMGLSDRNQDGTWLWSDGSRVDFTLWNPGEPTNVGQKDGVQGNYRKTKGWNDLGNHWRLASVCVLRHC
ncbi:hypothetical protein SKAU_G00383080 [Synaphobranchus kaupii]|uniref:C-type lectin domain-containing protein n=1 Tax=Synaphobranchus kaupii TaxID=118154 RepID=A0A9Q1EE32_SYNKA|nr:hypothetical protein SKAU_G00383080 [Synaphobranchus kaupii]